MSSTNSFTNNSARGTIDDFHVQWTRFQHQGGVYASEEFFWDYFGALLSVDNLRGVAVAEVGCGNGRFLKTIASHAKRVVGFEPSGAVEVARKYCALLPNVELIQRSVYDIPATHDFDLVMCLGVLHHLPDPVRALEIMRAMLKPGGHCLVWVYGREGNGLYLKIFLPIMKITSRLPHWLLHAVSFVLAIMVRVYGWLIAAIPILPWPMADYMRQVIARLDFYHLKLVVYDQLNPRIARYYQGPEIEALARQAGFTRVQLYHRHGYSWTVKLS